MVGITFCGTFVGMMDGGGDGVAAKLINSGISWTVVDDVDGGAGGAGGVQSLPSFVSFIHCSG